MTYTYVIVHVSPEVYGEIRAILQANNYTQAFHEYPEGEVIDMHGLALQVDMPPPAVPPPLRGHTLH